MSSVVNLLERRLKWLFNVLIEYIFPAYCVSCGNGELFLCNECVELIQEVSLAYRVDKCGFFLDGITVCCDYKSCRELQRAIHSFKYQFIHELHVPLGEILSDYLKRFNRNDYLVCPVPLHKKRLRWRGFNQSLLLARYAGQLTGHTVCELLERVSYSMPQQELTREERIENVRGAFGFVRDEGVIDRSGIEGKSIILIDDVATTLSTLEECAKVLKEAGFSRVYGIVLARVA